MFGQSKFAIQKDIMLRNLRQVASERYVSVFRWLIGIVVAGSIFFWWQNKISEDKTRSVIVDTVFLTTGYELELGDFHWTWLPFGLELTDVKLKLPADGTVLIAADQANLEVSIISMLSFNQSLVISALQLQGADIELQALADGTYSWYVQQADNAKTVGMPFEQLIQKTNQVALINTSTTMSLNTDVNELVLKDVDVTYHHAGRTYQVHFVQLKAEDIESFTSAAFTAVGHLETKGWPVVDFDIPGVISLGPKESPSIAEEAGSTNRTWALGIDSTKDDVLTGENDVTTTAKEQSSIISTYAARIVDGQFKIDGFDSHSLNLQIKFADQQWRLNLDVGGFNQIQLDNMIITKLFETIHWTAKTKVSFRSIPLLERLIDVQLPELLQFASLEGELQGIDGDISVSNAIVGVNKDTFAGGMTWVAEDINKIKIHLAGVYLNLSSWIDGGLTQTAASLLWPGRHKWEFLLDVDTLEYADLSFSGWSLVSRSEGKHIQAQIKTKEVLSGTLDTQIALDYTTEMPIVQLKFDVAGIDTVDFSKWAKFPLGLVASLTGSGQINMQGDNLADLLQSLQGAAKFTAPSGIFDSSGIKDQAMELALLTDDTITVQQWPEQLNFEGLQGAIQIGPGVDQQWLKAQIDNIQIKVRGAINPIDQLMDLEVGFIVGASAEGTPRAISGYLEDIEWSITCLGIYDTFFPCRLPLSSPSVDRIMKLVKTQKTRNFWLQHSHLDTLEVEGLE